jgi:8-oxo-dGTP pyrophosphatase MutT (NUDIX family)
VARVRARAPQLYDGPVLAFDRLDGDTIVCLGGRYFEMLATTDVLRDEYIAAGPDEELPLRDLAHTAAAGDPLRSGTGRAAAVGMTLVVTLPAADGRAMLLGRRRGDLGADPGSWHVPPSGMIEPGGSPLRESVVRELREELGLQLAEPNLVPLGIGWDLLRLRPEVCLRLDLGVEDVSGSGPTLSPSEYVETARIPLSTEGLKDFWQAHPPPAVTPAAAAAIALVEGGV